MGILDRLVARDKRAESLQDVDQRIQRIATPDFPLWVDNTVTHLGKHANLYFRDKRPEDLEEAKMAAATLSRLLEEAERR